MNKLGFEARFWAESCPVIKLFKVFKNVVDIKGFNVEAPDSVNPNWNEIESNFYTSYEVTLYNEDTKESIKINEVRQSSFIILKLNINKINYIELVDKLLPLDGLLTMHIFDNEDEYWQSADTTQLYSFANKSYSHLRKIPDPLGIGREYLDISENYGRFISLYRDRTMAAPINYYGNMFFNLIPKEYIANYKNFYSYEDHENYIVCVLFPEIFESERNRRKQEEFFKYLKLDTLSELIGNIYGAGGVPFDKPIDDRIKQLYT